MSKTPCSLCSGCGSLGFQMEACWGCNGSGWSQEEEESLNYFRFTENNNWEGEKWHWYIPDTVQNRQDIEKVRKLIADFEKDGDTCPYSVSATAEYTRAKVKTWCERDDNDRGYMPKHNLVTGFTKPIPDSVDWGNEDPFYKGMLFSK